MLPIMNVVSPFIPNDIPIIQKGSNAGGYDPLTNVYIPLNVTESNSALLVVDNIIAALNNNISEPSPSIYPNNIVSVSEYSSLSNIDSDVNTRGLNCYTPSIGSSRSAGIEVKILETNTALACESESDEWSYIVPLPKGCMPPPIVPEENIKPYCLDTLGNNPTHENTI